MSRTSSSPLRAPGAVLLVSCYELGHQPLGLAWPKAVDPVQYSIRLLVPPGSLLLTRPAMRPFLGPLDPAAFTYRWTHPDPRMDALYRSVSAVVAEAAGSGEKCGGDVPAGARARG